MPIAFIAGATGYTGRALMEELARRNGPWTARPHARKAGAFDGAVVCDPRDVAALTAGMRGCDAVVQLIGTVKARFADGDYDAIDYGTTVALGEAAKAAGVPRLLLLSSVGAGSGVGAYLACKQKTEKWVQASGLEHTIVRPSAIVGEDRRAAQWFGAVLTPSAKYRPIERHRLAQIFIAALENREAVKDRVLEGKSMWELLKKL
jgi:uncharacterized protein YbjT (DUF2867 family)